MGDICPVFEKVWKVKKKIHRAELFMTALGVYESSINGNRVGEYVLAPGWTSYNKRLQYQKYDITEHLNIGNNAFNVIVGKGWFRSPMPNWSDTEDDVRRKNQTCGLLAEIHIIYEDGSEEILTSDRSWKCGESAVRFSEIYDGESYNACFNVSASEETEEFEWFMERLILQEGEEIREMERVAAKTVFITPAGETIVDFGQEVTGYVEIEIDAKAGDEIRILHGEVLDKEGNFYNKNYRAAKAEIYYTCADGRQTWHPKLTFFGFRYLKLAEYPGEASKEQFTAICVYSKMERTGYIISSDVKLNKLFSNIIWGQKGNFLDVPTDCPQRDERLGWTGDAQVFVKAASYNYDVEKFFVKWLHDLKAEQRPDGAVAQVIPDYLPAEPAVAAWGDAATICPWQIYRTYGNVEILREHFNSMKMWVDYITQTTEEKYLWIGGYQLGDWLGLDAEPGSYSGASRKELIATAYYAYSTELLIKAGEKIGQNIEEYLILYDKIVHKFRETYPVYLTQTEHVAAIWFNLEENPQQSADNLAKMIKSDGYRMRTGFVGTAYILHVLSKYGYTDLSYTLLLREDYPSWLYSVNKGATTIWEHWDGIMENGEFWNSSMNSFNHYAYGAVADWIYEEAAGIRPAEDGAGFTKAWIEPKADKRLKWLEASIKTRNGEIVSRWSYEETGIRYDIKTPVDTTIIIDGKKKVVGSGIYTFWGML